MFLCTAHTFLFFFFIILLLFLRLTSGRKTATDSLFVRCTYKYALHRVLYSPASSLGYLCTVFVFVVNWVRAEFISKFVGCRLYSSELRLFCRFVFPLNKNINDYGQYKFMCAWLCCFRLSLVVYCYMFRIIPVGHFEFVCSAEFLLFSELLHHIMSYNRGVLVDSDCSDPFCAVVFDVRRRMLQAKFSSIQPPTTNSIIN